MAMHLTWVKVGFSDSSDDDQLMIDGQISKRPTRKDIATSFTRRLIFYDVPDIAISPTYTGVSDVTIGAQFMEAQRMISLSPLDRAEWFESRFDRCLRVVSSPKSSVASLHIAIQFPCSTKGIHEDISTLLAKYESGTPRSYGWHIETFSPDMTTLRSAYELQAVVHLPGGRFFGFFDSEHIEHLAQELAWKIEQCLDEGDVKTPDGQFFLCDAPLFVLSPHDFVAASNPEQTAMSKIYGLIDHWPDLSGSQYKTNLEYFRSRVKLVESDFRPSVKDLYPRPQST